MEEGTIAAAYQAFFSAVNLSRFFSEWALGTTEIQRKAKVLFLGVMEIV